jgi:hypothetical protein
VRTGRKWREAGEHCIMKVKVKAKLSLCFLTKHHAMKAYGGVEV